MNTPPVQTQDAHARLRAVHHAIGTLRHAWERKNLSFEKTRYHGEHEYAHFNDEGEHFVTGFTLHAVAPGTTFDLTAEAHSPWDAVSVAYAEHTRTGDAVSHAHDVPVPELTDEKALEEVTNFVDWVKAHS